MLAAGPQVVTAPVIGSVANAAALHMLGTVAGALSAMAAFTVGMQLFGVGAASSCAVVAVCCVQHTLNTRRSHSLFLVHTRLTLVYQTHKRLYKVPSLLCTCLCESTKDSPTTTC